MKTLTVKTSEDIRSFVDQLKRQGINSMYGVAAHLMNKFGYSKAQAFEIYKQYWR